MAPRPRSRSAAGLPPNLYNRGGYYSWRNPLDGKEHGLGRDKGRAIAEANEANLHIIGLLKAGPRLIDRLTGDGERSVGDWIERYLQSSDDKKLAQATRAAITQRLNIVRAKLGNLVLARVTTLDIATFLAPWEESGKKRMAQAIRSILLDLFREAQAKGWRSDNPVTPTRSARVAVKRARLTLEQFRAIHTAAATLPAYVQRSMELAIVTGQRREDLGELGPRDVHGGRLWVQQGKTGTRISIPLDLRLDVLGWSVGQMIERCRDAVVSRHLLHHSTHAGRAKPGHKVRLQTISAGFAEARDAAFPDAEATWPGRTPPSFHELRSLSARLYTDQGVDAQALLGHKSPDMTAIYRDVRGAEWIDVKIA